jgi:hypothetical protein
VQTAVQALEHWPWQRRKALTRAKPRGPLYNAISKVIEAIDDVAEVAIGGPNYQRDATTPGDALPPVKRRTEE